MHIKKQKLLRLALILMVGITSSIFAQNKTIKAIDILKSSGSKINYKALDSGEIINIARTDQELTDTSIALSMVLYVKAPYSKVLKDIKASSNVLSSYKHALLIPIKDTSSLTPYLAKVEFVTDEKKEVADIFDFDGADNFNLSKDEIKKWQALTKGKKADIKIASQFHQRVLKNRLQEYLKGGIEGISSYNHLDSDTTVVKGMEKSSTFLNSFKSVIPDLYSDYMNFSKVTSKDTKEVPLT